MFAQKAPGDLGRIDFYFPGSRDGYFSFSVVAGNKAVDFKVPNHRAFEARRYARV
jgi:hypothetical protein